MLYVVRSSKWALRLTKAFVQRRLINTAQVMSAAEETKILGIESSCDDTGCAIVTSNGEILGEALESQLLHHLNAGGVIPVNATVMHRKSLPNVCERTLKMANMRLSEVDAIAITTEPGIQMCLNAGLIFAKRIACQAGKPLIPIHHMQAHALIVRMVENIEFPYLTLLISGGHTLLALATDINKFYILGQTGDNALGEMLDKVSRRLKLRNIVKYESLSGGQAIELAAKNATNPNQFTFMIPLQQQNDCKFSFSSFRACATKIITQEELSSGTKADEIIPDVSNFCAGLQLSTAIHLCRRVQIGFEYLDRNDLIPIDKRVLVVSGGVACNDFFMKALSNLCTHYNYKCVRAPPKWCNDNGVMIAWNGIEKWGKCVDIAKSVEEKEKLSCNGKSPIGDDWSEDIKNARLKCKRVNITQDLF